MEDYCIWMFSVHRDLNECHINMEESFKTEENYCPQKFSLIKIISKMGVFSLWGRFVCVDLCANCLLEIYFSTLLTYAKYVFRSLEPCKHIYVLRVKLKLRDEIFF